jgi:hypothetical protein
MKVPKGRKCPVGERFYQTACQIINFNRNKYLDASQKGKQLFGRKKGKVRKLHSAATSCALAAALVNQGLYGI